MDTAERPRVRLVVGPEPPAGENTYQAIPEMVEFRLAEKVPAGVHTLAMGRLAIAVDGGSGALAGLQCHVRTARWRHGEPPPEPDAEGVLVLEFTPGADGFAYLPAELRFLWHEESSSLRINLQDGLALVFKVADCLMAGIDRSGSLTDIWLLRLDLALE